MPTGIALWLALGLAIGVTYTTLLYRRAQLRSDDGIARRLRVDRNLTRLLQTAIVAAASIWIAWIVFGRPPAAEPPRPPVKESRCCEEVRKALESHDSRPTIFGRTAGEIGIVGAIAAAAAGYALYRAGRQTAGIAMMAFSGLLTVSSAKLLPIDKVFDVKKAIGIDSLLTFNMNSVSGSHTGAPPVPPEGLEEFSETIDQFDTGETKLPSTEKIEKILRHGSPSVVFLVGQADARELRNELLKQYRSNWNLATQRAQAVATHLGCAHVVIGVTPPIADAKAPEDKLALDRSVTIHAFFRKPQ